MSDELLVRHCSPTLAGIKTGSLFTVSHESTEGLNRDIENFNSRFGGKGIKAVALHKGKNRTMIYVYRPNELRHNLNDPEAQTILARCGYSDADCKNCIRKLKSRFEGTEVFPHEIGLFLGYPPEDVKGFIENKASNYKYTGYWKVYGDVEKAKEKFNCFSKCSANYYARLQSGTEIEKLIVAC